MAKLEFNNKLRPVKPKFNYAKAGIKKYDNYNDFEEFYNDALKDLENNDVMYRLYDKFITQDPSGAFIAVDNTSGELFTEEFETEEEAWNYLLAKKEGK